MNEPYTLHVGDCRTVLPALAAESIDCCVTSPPYWGLRDYGYTGQIGQETTPDELVANLVDVFREVRRVLRDNGTLWLNLGDSYTSGGRSTFRSSASSNKGQHVQNDQSRPPTPPGLKDKDLVGLPWMVAFALRSDGWYLRQDVIWHKPNPMPESVKDRCTKAHEYLFLLSKSPRYYFDQITEPEVCGRKRGKALHPDTVSTNGNSGLSRREPTGYRNARSVWTISTRPFKGAHFATFPPALAERCVLAGCPPGGVVLDPFAGSGTVAEVCIQHNRHAVLIEASEPYADIARRRLAEVA